MGRFFLKKVDRLLNFGKGYFGKRGYVQYIQSLCVLKCAHYIVND